MIDTLQAIRMTAFWPVIVAVIAAQVTLLVCDHYHWYKPQGTVLVASIIAGAAWLAAQSINALWDDSSTYWWAFTLGLGLAAVVLAIATGRELRRRWMNGQT